MESLAQRIEAARRAAPSSEGLHAETYTEAQAFHLVNQYSAMERVLQQLTVVVNGEPPVSSQWHADLLRRMTLDVPGLRPPVLQSETAAVLDPESGREKRQQELVFPGEFPFQVSRSPALFYHPPPLCLAGADGVWVS